MEWLTWAIPVAFLTLILVVGLVRIVLRARTLIERRNFLVDFTEHFVNHASNPNGTPEDYVWLLDNVARAQRETASISMNYRPPFANYMIPNYQILTNTIPNIITGRSHHEDIVSCETVLRMKMGELREGIEAFDKGLKNPFNWFYVGVQGVLAVPIFLMESFGLISSSSAESAKSSRLYRFLSSIAALLAVAASIVTIIQAWDDVARVLGL